MHGGNDQVLDSTNSERGFFGQTEKRKGLNQEREKMKMHH